MERIRRSGGGASGAPIALVALGDLGRSPRVQHHALALAQRGLDVRLVGLGGSECAPEVEGHPKIAIRRLGDPLARSSGAFRAPRAALRAALQHAQLLRALLHGPAPTAILVQNPPAIPTLLVAWLAARLRGARWIVDWHNFSGAILAASLGSDRPIARAVGAWERALGRRADGHLCVSRAMAERLAGELGIDSARVLYDRPVSRFAPIPADQRRARRRALLDRYLPGRGAPEPPACAVCPTSWSDDDDVGLLLDALSALDRALDAQAPRDAGSVEPRLHVLLSGRGPNRARFEARIGALALRHVRIDALWVSAADYPELLGCADLGVCVHRSASGVDLPMKVVDLIGAGVPVCALAYGCLDEQLRDGDGALLFRDADALARQLFALFGKLPDPSTELDRLAAAMAELRARTPSWEAEWEAVALPLLRGDRDAARIAFFHPDFGLGGAERWLVDAALALCDAGHRVVVITSRFDPEHCFEPARDGRLEVRVRGGLWPASVFGRLRAPCAIARSTLAVLSSALRGERYDAVWVDLVPHVIPLLRVLGRPAVLYYCHHPDQLMARHARRVGRWYDAYRSPIDALEVRAARRADRVLANSRFTREAVERVYALPRGAVEVLHPGIEPGPEAGEPDEARIVLACIGRFDPAKRFDVAVDAVGRVAARVDPALAARVELVIAGGYDADQPGCERALRGLERAARAAGIADRVSLLRSPSDAELRGLLQRCRALIHPAPDEHFGIVPIEAMAAGRAVVAAGSGGLRETVEAGRTGLLCEPDAASFADAIERVVVDAPLARALGRAGRERAVRCFSIDGFARRVCDVVGEALDGSGAGR